MLHLGLHVAHATESGDELKKFCRGEERRGRFRFWDDTDVGFHLLWVVHGVNTEDLNSALARPELPGEEFDERGFTGPVWTKHPKELTSVNLNVKGMQCDEITVFFCHVYGTDHRLCLVSHAPLISFLIIIPWFVLIDVRR